MENQEEKTDIEEHQEENVEEVDEKQSEETTVEEAIAPESVVEEINDSDIYGSTNNSSEEDEVATPKINDETADDMDEWKI